MKIFTTIPEIDEFIIRFKQDAISIGFVPTMGALHSGHISLIERAKKENDVVGCSIFVNPIQFNKKEDLEKYPRTFEEDVRNLNEVGCDFLFNPSVDEMYPGPVTEKYDFGFLDTVMEGEHRPGHFNGVAVIVRKLFEIFKPEKAYFGMKDYQQLCVIQAMTEMHGLPVEIIPCPTVRESDGLAMSSRNVRLSAEARKIAPEIYHILSEAQKRYNVMSAADLENWAIQEFGKFHEFDVEYFKISDSKTLQSFKNWSEVESAIACTAVFLGGVRLIDNLIIF
jgi:pantoate--beta-alanine ligase